MSLNFKGAFVFKAKGGRSADQRRGTRLYNITSLTLVGSSRACKMRAAARETLSELRHQRDGIPLSHRKWSCSGFFPLGDGYYSNGQYKKKKNETNNEGKARRALRI